MSDRHEKRIVRVMNAVFMTKEDDADPRHVQEHAFYLFGAFGVALLVSVGARLLADDATGDTVLIWTFLVLAFYIMSRVLWMTRGR